MFFNEQTQYLINMELFIGNKSRPKKKDVINTVSINSPYLIDLNQKRTQFAKYAEDHKEALKSFDNEDNLLNTMLNRYGWNKRYPYLYDNYLFDTAFELMLYIYAVDHDIEIKRNPRDIAIKYVNPWNENERIIYPDIKFGDKYINIRPKYFYRDSNPNNEMICPYPIWEVEDYEEDMIDLLRDFYYMGHEERSEENCNRLFEIIHKAGVDAGVEYWNEDDFEEISQYIYDNYSDDYIPLFIMGIPFPWPNDDLHDTSPMGLVRHFHKSIFEARHGNEPNALEVWDNKEVFKELALNRLKYVGECGLDRMRQGLNISKISIKVSIFKSTLADRLIKQYLYDAKEIVDPFSGFSGRLLGAFINHIPYIGRDVNPKHIQESLQLAEWWNNNKYPVQCDLAVADATATTGIYDCLLTCSPYATIDRYGARHNLEDWNNPGQLALTCDEWIDICLNNFKCRKYVFVVDDSIIKYRPYIVDTVSNYGHMSRNIEYVLFFDFTDYSLNCSSANNGFGITPFDINKDEEYAPIVGKGVSPFDIGGKYDICKNDK